MDFVRRHEDTQVTREKKYVCWYYKQGICRFGSRCRNLHEEIQPVRSPEKNKSPEKKITQENHLPESLIESVNNTLTLNNVGSTSSAQTSEALSKTCGICFDTILEKPERHEQTFGILPNCNHCFCFACIRKWRKSKEFEFEVSKACPECRVASCYVYPSKIWYEIKEDKESFIGTENARMQKIDCNYFKKGAGTCPFGNTCLYLHALPNGKKIDVGPPKSNRRKTMQMDMELLYWLNDDDDFNLEDDFSDDDDDDDDFELDLDDPLIAMQYYDHDDIRRYIAMDRLMNPHTDSDSDEYDMPYWT